MFYVSVHICTQYLSCKSSCALDGNDDMFVYVYLTARISQKPFGRTLQNYVCMWPVAVA